MNKNAFTLIELLAVIVILGVITTIAVPQYNDYIEKSKRSAFVDSAKNYVRSVDASIVSSKFKAPVKSNDVTIINLNMIELVSGSDESPYGFAFVPAKSYVAVINEGTELNPSYAYYFAAQDEQRNAIPLTRIEEITEDSVVNDARNTMEVTVQSLAGNIAGVETTKGIISGLDNREDAEGKFLDWNVLTYTKQGQGEE